VKNILVVGAGFAGSVIARELANNNYNVTIIDRRNHIGGNAFDFINEEGIMQHMYGPHLFHTKNKGIFDYLSQYTEWIPYKHKVKAMLSNGNLVTLPANSATAQIVGKENIVDTFFRPYSEKMWGLKLEEIDPDIINRIRIREDDNEYYFPDDDFQVLPKEGYTHLFTALLDHSNINVKLNTAFKKEMEDGFDHIFNSMPIDDYYSFCYGELPYRSIKFHSKKIDVNRLFPVSVVNFTHKEKYTRVTEWKNIPSHQNSKIALEPITTLTFEEPCCYKENNYERYYPVKDLAGKNRELYKKYEAIENSKVTFIGRLGLYTYLDMDQVVNSSIITAKKFLKK
jgi:UDP-galactopyranose mutase